MLSIYKLSVFIKISQEGSFSKAAKVLYLTQSAVSQHISVLEKQLGTPLFERKQRGVELTKAGKTLLEYAQQILWLAQAAESAITNVENLEKGILNLGATPSASIYLLPDWMNNFHHQYPSISFSLETNTTSKIITQIKNQSLELGIVEGEVKKDDSLNIVLLRDTELLIIVHPEHAWSGLDSISIRTLGEEPFIARRTDSQTRTWVDHLLAKYDIIPQIAFEFDDPESIKRAVIRKMGISILPACAIQEELKNKQLISISLQEGILKRQLKCISSSKFPLSAISRAFLIMLSKKFPALSSASNLPQSLPSDLFSAQK